jgi:hypothetical protein
MVLAYHATWTAYGFWLPNDQRGSWSDFVRSWDLYLTGDPTKVTDRRSLAHQPFDPAQRRAARSALTYDPVRFSPGQIQIIAQGIERAVAESGYVLRSLAILFDHVHSVVMRYDGRTIEKIVGHLKTRATQALTAANLNPMVQFAAPGGRYPSVWAQHGWNVFLNDEEEIERAVDYDERNPMKMGLPSQHWGFVRRNWSR